MAREALHAELVVIGGGAAGMPAALEAIEKGVSPVILLDKRPVPGGNARMAGGYMFAADAYTQKEAGVEVHGMDVYRDQLAFHHSVGINPRQVKAYIDRTADNLEWLRSKGIQYEYNPFMGNGLVGAGAPGSYAKVLDQLRGEFTQRGGIVLTNTPAQEILIDDQCAVCGVRATTKDGSDLVIETKHVFLATGGFMGNPALMQKYFNDQYDESAYVTDALKLTGDGIAMAEKAGALLSPRATLCKESGFSFSHQANAPHRIAMYRCAVWVNRDGVRFCDESTAAEHTNANLLVSQPGMYGYSIMDANMLQDLIMHPTPQVNNEFLTPGDPKVRTQLETLATKCPDQCLITDNIEEIAQWIGAKPAVLQETIAAYNHFCADGQDREFFKPSDHMMPLEKAPYYVCKFSPLMVETIGPVMVNHHFQVLRQADRAPIPGLYAGGAVTSGWTGHDYELWGGNLSYGMSSGRIAADYIAASCAKKRGVSNDV